MPTPRKAGMLADLEDTLTRSKVVISTDYRGLNVKELQALRRKLREANIEYKVVKNTITALAAKNAGRENFEQVLLGPTALVVGYDDDVGTPAKVLTEYIRSTRLNLPIHGGYLDGQVLKPAEVQDLASLPSRDQLLADLMAKFNSPIATLQGLLQATLRDFASLIDARATQLEEQPA
jgi:large subunit ribosomal protein L10